MTWLVTIFLPPKLTAAGQCAGVQLAQKLGSDEAQRAWRLACANWALVAVMGLGLGLGLTLFGFTLDLPDFGIVLGIAAIYGVMGFFHLWRKQVPDPKVALILTAIGQLIFIVAFMGPLTYVAGAFDFPLRDDLYLAANRVLGLDPRLLLAFVNDRPELAMWFETAYGMIRWPLIGIPVILAMAMRYERLQLFVMAFGIALIATLAVSALLPAVGTYYGLGIGPETITPNLNAMIYGKQAQDIPAIRDGSLRDLEVFKLAGIVAFPSFHAASAISTPGRCGRSGALASRRRSSMPPCWRQLPSLAPIMSLMSLVVLASRCCRSPPRDVSPAARTMRSQRATPPCRRRPHHSPLSRRD